MFCGLMVPDATPVRRSSLVPQQHLKMNIRAVSPRPVDGNCQKNGILGSRQSETKAQFPFLERRLSVSPAEMRSVAGRFY